MKLKQIIKYSILQLKNLQLRIIVIKVTLFIALLKVCTLLCVGCSAGKSGLLQITPQQYFYYAKEKLETIDERNYEIRDLDEIIRILENAEKDARTNEIIDKSRVYLVLANTLKAKRQYQSNLMRGIYLANRAEPFYVLDTKSVLETLRNANKWLRMCITSIKTQSIKPDLLYVTALYNAQKMLTQRGSEREKYLWLAIKAFRQCFGKYPDYKSDFKLYGRVQTTKDVKLAMAETLAYAGLPDEAWFIIHDNELTPLEQVQASDPKSDYQWLQLKGLVLAMMGQYDEALKVLSQFKIVSQQDYPKVDEALWLLEGVYDKLYQLTNDISHNTEAKIVSTFIRKLKSPYAKEKYTTASHLFPTLQHGDQMYYRAIRYFTNGDYYKSAKILENLVYRNLLKYSNRISAKIVYFESLVYSNQIIEDDLIEELITLALEKKLNPLQRERLGYILGRYILHSKPEYSKDILNPESKSFTFRWLNTPWTISVKYKSAPKPSFTRREITEKRNIDAKESRKGKILESEKEPERSDKRLIIPHQKQQTSKGKVDVQDSIVIGDENSIRENSSLIVESYINRSDDWITSMKLSLIEIPTYNLLGSGNLVGREERDGEWVFIGKEIDMIRIGKVYLGVFSYDTAEGEKFTQGYLIRFD